MSGSCKGAARGGYASRRQERCCKAVAKPGNRLRKAKAGEAREGCPDNPGGGRGELQPTNLHISTASRSRMTAGDIVFLDDFSDLREAYAADFVAVLACPWCGAPGLVTFGQYSRGVPIVCTSKRCSGFFRVVGEAQIVSLRVC